MAVGSGASGAIISNLLMVVFFAVIQGVIWGLITKYVSGKKNRQGGFAWGFWLGLIGLLVVGFLPAQNKDSCGDVASDNGVETLEKLAKLHEQGVLNDEEFAQKKETILKRM